MESTHTNRQTSNVKTVASLLRDYLLGMLGFFVMAFAGLYAASHFMLPLMFVTMNIGGHLFGDVLVFEALLAGIGTAWALTYLCNRWIRRPYRLPCLCGAILGSVWPLLGEIVRWIALGP